MKSLLCTTSSIAGHYPIPCLATYSATKKFVDSFTWAMKAELASFGVDVCAWQAGTVSTKLNDYTKDRLAVSSTAYAYGVLNRCTSGLSAGVLSHDLSQAFLECVADLIPLNLVMWSMMQMTMLMMKSKKK